MYKDINDVSAGFTDRLKRFIEENYDSREQFSNSIGMNYQTVSQYFNSTRKSKPGYNFFTAFLSKHSVADLAYLLKGTEATGSLTVNEPSAAYASNDINKLLRFLESGKMKVQIEIG